MKPIDVLRLADMDWQSLLVRLDGGTQELAAALAELDRLKPGTLRQEHREVVVRVDRAAELLREATGIIANQDAPAEAGSPVRDVASARSLPRTQQRAAALSSGPPGGLRIMVVEDDYLIASDLVDVLHDARAETVGPVSSIEGALELVRTVRGMDGALLDVALHGRMAFPVADALLETGIPFVFATGYDGTVIPRRFAGVPRWGKPIRTRDVHELMSLWTARRLAPA